MLKPRHGCALVACIGFLFASCHHAFSFIRLVSNTCLVRNAIVPSWKWTWSVSSLIPFRCGASIGVASPVVCFSMYAVPSAVCLLFLPSSSRKTLCTTSYSHELLQHRLVFVRCVPRGPGSNASRVPFLSSPPSDRPVHLPRTSRCRFGSSRVELEWFRTTNRGQHPRVERQANTSLQERGTTQNDRKARDYKRPR